MVTTCYDTAEFSEQPEGDNLETYALNHIVEGWDGMKLIDQTHAAAKVSEEELSEYQEKRLKRMKEIDDFMAKIGLGQGPLIANLQSSGGGLHSSGAKRPAPRSSSSGESGDFSKSSRQKRGSGGGNERQSQPRADVIVRRSTRKRARD